MHRISKYLNLALSIPVLLLTFPVQAESNSTTSNPSFPKQIQFIPPKDGKTPNTVGAGTRNPNELRCSPEEEQITALMPKGNYGLTLQDRPSIFVYLPQTVAKQVVLAIQDETEAYHEIAFLPITKHDQIVSFTLPEDKPSLTPGTYYKWKLTLVCGDIPNVEDPKLEGWLKHIDRNSLPMEMSPTDAISLGARHSVIAKMNWYSQNGYWYDLLLQLETAQKANPDDPQIASIWQDLLQKVQSGEI
ncbi:MAG: DUF928 domain-containing protein [Cyanobacteria bacterium P01_F01_bin.143]